MRQVSLNIQNGGSEMLQQQTICIPQSVVHALDRTDHSTATPLRHIRSQESESHRSEVVAPLKPIVRHFWSRSRRESGTRLTVCSMNNVINALSAILQCPLYIYICKFLCTGQKFNCYFLWFEAWLDFGGLDSRSVIAVGDMSDKSDSSWLIQQPDLCRLSGIKCTQNNVVRRDKTIQWWKG